MKILIDLQALQTGSALRGIGRYATSLLSGLLEISENYDIHILLNDSIQKIQSGSVLANLQAKIGDDNFHYFPLPNINNPALQLYSDEVKLSKILRECLIEAIEPDVLLVMSLFEFEAIATIPCAQDRSYFCATILYDLIPLSDPDGYLGNSILRKWYEDRLNQLKNADAILSISEYVRNDALYKLDIKKDVIKNISSGTNLNRIISDLPIIKKRQLDFIDHLKPYILYVGGYDKRKNIEFILDCYLNLPKKIKHYYKFVLAGSITEVRKKELEYYVFQRSREIKANIVFLGFVNDEDLIYLYKNSHLFVFPSLDEGFGLPPLEAMSFGIPTLTSNCGSLPEVMGNNEALFDPRNPKEVLNKIIRGIEDLNYRNNLIDKGIAQSQLFSWNNSANAAINFILERKKNVLLISEKKYLSLRDFLYRLYFRHGIKFTEIKNIKLINLLARAIYSNPKIVIDGYKLNSTKDGFKLRNSFLNHVPNYSELHSPYVFSSMLCREQHFHLPLYTYWCKKLQETPRFHRKQWEFVYICQSLYERGYLRPGLSAVGFGVGKEPLVSYFASCGIKVMATDLDFAMAQKLGWVSTAQHSNSLSSLNNLGLCDTDDFNKLASFRNVDMNNIPNDLGKFDFCWSSCAFEHLGSIRKGLDFVINSAKLLKPGGIAVHTTEFNISSNLKTLDNNPSFVIFRRCDIELLEQELGIEGYEIEPLDFSSGQDELESYIDLPPYLDEPHLRLQLAGEFISTSLGLIIKAPALN